MLMIVLIVLVVLALSGGFIGSGRYGYASWSPLGIILFILIILWLSGGLHGRL